MFDGVSGMDWVFIGAALALGFGVVNMCPRIPLPRELAIRRVAHRREPNRQEGV
jgi:hypothetical protein